MISFSRCSRLFGVLAAALLCATPIGASAKTAAPKAPAHPKIQAEHVIVIGVDGLSTDGVQRADTPVLHEMMKSGVWSVHARGVMPTTSGANWASVIDGAGPEQHGVTSNDWKVGEFNFPASVNGSGGFFPSIFQVLTDQKPQLEIGSIYQWDGFGNLYDHRFVDYDIHADDEDKTASLAAAYVKAKRPNFLFVHLDLVDHAGHTFGWGSPEYYAAVAKADRLIGQIRAAVREAGLADETAMFVTSDHGGVGKGHGGESLAELEIPWIVAGAGIKRGLELDQPINTYDTAATAAWLLGAQRPYAWIGRPVRAILTGRPASDQLYRTSSFYAAPIIEPVDGGGGSGGLFVGRPGQMTIRNPGGVGEVRFTLDNSIPTAQSTLYSGPLQLSRSTIVRAGLFIDGKAASVPSRGYFRVLADPAGHGVSYRTYLLTEGTARLPDFDRLTPATAGTTYEFSVDGLKLPREESVAVVFDGFLTLAAGGTYKFALASDDGSKLFIDGKQVVDNDGQHGILTSRGEIDLQPGKHAIRVEWFQGGGGAWLGAYMEGPGLPNQFIDANLLSPK